MEASSCSVLPLRAWHYIVVVTRCHSIPIRCRPRWLPPPPASCSAAPIRPCPFPGPDRGDHAIPGRIAVASRDRSRSARRPNRTPSFLPSPCSLRRKARAASHAAAPARRPARARHASLARSRPHPHHPHRARGRPVSEEVAVVRRDATHASSARLAASGRGRRATARYGPPDTGDVSSASGIK